MAEPAAVQLEPGSHACLPYASPAELHGPVAAFVGEGLRRGECCQVVSAPEHLDAIAARLHQQGIPVAHHQTRGALRLLRMEGSGPGRFDAAAAVAAVQEGARRAREQGFVGFRGAGGPPPKHLSDAEREAMLAYEGAVTEVLRAHKVAGLCLYDRHTSGARMLHGVLCTHPLAMAHGELCENPFWSPDPRHLQRLDATEQVDWMLERLEAVARRERRLREVNQTLLREIATLAAEADWLRERDQNRARALELRSGLIGVLARQLRTPLVPLQTAIDGLTRSAAPPLEAQERAHEAVGRLERLAIRLDEIAAFVDADVTTHEESLDLVLITHDTIEAWRGRGGRGAQVRVLAPGALPGTWDRCRLTGLLDQLLAVALDGCWGTPIEVVAESVGPRARLSVRYQDGETAAADQGQHMASTVQDRLSLALWTARETAHMLGGSLGLSVWPDGRVAMTLDLPRRPAPDA